MLDSLNSEEKNAIDQQEEAGFQDFVTRLLLAQEGGTPFSGAYEVKYDGKPRSVQSPTNLMKPIATEQTYQSIFNCIRNNDKDELLKYLDQQDFIVDKRVLVPKIDKEGKSYQEAYSALHIAVEEGFLELTEFILDRGADINIMTSLGFTPLAIASDMNHVEIVNYLLMKGADPNIVDNTYDPEFGTRRDGYTALMQAIERGSVEVCANLLSHGADPDILGGWTGITALTKACASHSKYSLVSLLLAHGADPNIRTSHAFYNSPLFMVLQGKDLDHGRSIQAMASDVSMTYRLMSLLLANGADPNPARGVLEDGSIAISPMSLMMVSNEDKVAIRGIMDVTHHATRLHKACAENDLKMLREVLKSLQTDESAASVIEARDRDGWTPLHLAIFLGSMDSVRLLLASDADPFAVTDCGKTTLHLACSRRGSPVIITSCMKMLVQSMANRKREDQVNCASAAILSLRQRTTMEEAKTVFETLEKIFNNIKMQPEDHRFRVLKKGNSRVASSLLKYPEPEKLLILAGFEIKDSTIELKQTLDLQGVERVLTIVQQALHDLICEWDSMY